MQCAPTKQQIKVQIQSSTDRITTSLSLARQRKKKQKSSAEISPYSKLTETTRPTLEGQKPKGRKSSTLKPGKRRPQTQYIKKKMKKQRNTTQMKEQTRNTEVQINEEEIGELPEKEFRITIVKMIKNLENKMEKCKT